MHCWTWQGTAKREFPEAHFDDRKSVLTLERRSARYKELCGIVGYTHKTWTPPPRRIQDATATLIHRGPDQQGVFQSGLFSVGAARLKIIDLDSGSQPILSGYEKFRAHPQSQADYTMRGPFEEIGRNPSVHFPEFDQRRRCKILRL